MKKTIAILLTFAILFSFASCGKKGDSPEDIYAEVGVEISTDAFPEDTVLKVETVKTEDKKYETVKTALPKAVKIDAYEITAESKGVAVQPDGSVKVTFPVPKSYDSDKHDVEVYFVADDGTTEKITATATKDGVVAELKHFSTYVVILVEKEAVASEDTTASSEDAAASSSPSSSESSSSAPSSSKKSSSASSKPQEVKIPTLSEVKVQEMVSNFLWASKYAYNVNNDIFSDFYGASLKSLDDLTVLSFLYRYCRDDLKKYKTETETGYTTAVPKSELDALAKRYLGYTYDFTKSYDGNTYMIAVEYDSKTKKVIYTEFAGGFGDPDGFRVKDYKQSGDTLKADLVYYSYTEERPDGVEGADWIDASEEDYVCYYELSNYSTLTFKYVDGYWRIISLKAK